MASLRVCVNVQPCHTCPCCCFYAAFFFVFTIFFFFFFCVPLLFFFRRGNENGCVYRVSCISQRARGGQKGTVKTRLRCFWWALPGI